MKKKYSIILFILAFITGIVVSMLILYCTKTFTITYDTKGGTIYQSTTVKAGKNIILPENEPYMMGYIFDGWYVDDKKITNDYKIYEDTTVIAKFISLEDYESQ